MTNRLLCLFFLSCWVAGSSGQIVPQSRWRWPDDRPPPVHPASQPAILLRTSGSPGSVRTGAGRLIPSAPSVDKINQPFLPKQQLQVQPKPFVPLPIRPLAPASPPSSPVANQLPLPQPRPQPLQIPQAPQPPQPPQIPVSSKPAMQATPQTEDAPVEPVKNKSVPLLKDAGKPGNPYVLLNDIFPPEKSIRTKEEEEANFQNLLKADLGGLDPHEVYLADNDLFVVRGFNFKKPYNPDPAGPPIDDYVAPAPNPPPAPEPGTVFYPSNDTDQQLPEFFPDFNGTDVGQMPPFVPFIPAGLNDTEPGFFPGFPPFPFLPPPPPHWDSEKELNEINSPGQFPPNFPNFPNFPLPPGGPQSPPFPPFFNGTHAPPPPTGLPPSLPPGFTPNQGGAFPPNQGGLPPNQGNFPPNQGGVPPLGGPFPGFPPVNGTVDGSEDIDESVPFTPLFPERPVEFYFPTHNTTEVPPGPNGPGIFVPPPKEYFAPRNESDAVDVSVPPALFKEPFNLPNYFEVTTAPPKYEPAKEFHPLPVKPLVTQSQSHVPVTAVTTQRPVVLSPVLPTLPPHVKVVPGPGPIYVNTKGIVEDAPAPYYSFRPLNPPVQRQPVQQRPQYQAESPYKGKPISLESDINVNNRHPRPPINPDSEIVDVHRGPGIGEAPRWSAQRERPAPTGYKVQAQPQSYQYERRGGQRIEHNPASLGPEAVAAAARQSGNFVTVYRFGGGSYTYNLNGKRR